MREFVGKDHVETHVNSIVNMFGAGVVVGIVVVVLLRLFQLGLSP
jgi:hypothetical protein